MWQYIGETNGQVDVVDEPAMWGRKWDGLDAGNGRLIIRRMLQREGNPPGNESGLWQREGDVSGNGKKAL